MAKKAKAPAKKVSKKEPIARYRMLCSTAGGYTIANKFVGELTEKEATAIMDNYVKITPGAVKGQLVKV